MPELPEVEVTRRGIEPVLVHARIERIWHDGKPLREPFSPELKKLEGAAVRGVSRRAKYILILTDKGTLIIHLGMTGHLRVLTAADYNAPGKHDHFELTTDRGVTIRLNDIRRFGLVIFIDKGLDPLQSPRLRDLGPEPLGEGFSPEYLYGVLGRMKKSIKQSLMDPKVVVGIGNIYACEVLFLSGISPFCRACKISREECEKLFCNIVAILKRSISMGGTTIRNFSGADGKMGYFVQDLYVYGRRDQPCRRCGTLIKAAVQGQRSTFYCPLCQKLPE